ncbi:hypothetical protein B5X24_HaOG210376 [Helicoverpa armigera]|uniref:SCP domain-containing protein n=1 Tax=Helicoverpa armigera TaxID=29058 RepID=A0A2W1BJ70_HELAM|nr:hypothetical protein B5X24_HaOG210376 [Helicoverpa armigera]
MCMYYDHKQEFGPRCGHPVQIEITERMVDKVLEYINDVRGRLSSGAEKGMDNEPLPRAYGMMKIQWDRELATLAQVLANQCLGGREDLCRATERFPNPSQSIAIIHFSYPDWEYLKIKNHNDTSKGLNEEKLTFALKRFIKSAHALKRTVNKDIITDCPALYDLPDVNTKYYLNLIRGSATHIGCGLSAYSKYRIGDDNESIQNSVQVVCNVSDGPQRGQPVYNTNPPFIGGSFSKHCGCPRGYRETHNCLCEEDPEYSFKSSVSPSLEGYLNLQTKYKHKKLKDPIIKLNSFRPLVERGRLQVKSDSEEDENVYSSKSTEQMTQSDDETDVIKMIQPILRNKRPSELHLDREDIEVEIPQVHIRNRNTTSVENDSPKFVKNNMKTSNQYKELKKGIPQNAKYAQTKRYNKSSPAESNREKSLIRLRVKSGNIVDDVMKVDEEPTESSLNFAEKFMVENEHLSKPESDNKRNKERNSSKLLRILKILQQEVKNTQFDTKLHQEFDTKMQEIYEIATPSESAESERDITMQVDDLDKTYPDNKNTLDSYKNIEDEIVTLRKQPNRPQINDVKRTHDDDEIIRERSYDYFDDTEPKYANSVDNPYDKLLTKKNSFDLNRNNQSTYNRHPEFKYNDILDGKVNLDRRFYSIIDDKSHRHLNREQRTPDDDMLVRKSILSKALEDTDTTDNYNYEGKNILPINTIENRKKIMNANKIKLTKTPARKLFLVPERRAQFNPTFQQRNTNGDFRQMKLLRPKFEDISSKYPFQRQLSYLSDRDI